MTQIFSPASDMVARSVLVPALIVPLLLVALAYGIAGLPSVTGQKMVITQPVPFSHEHHVTQLGLDCRYCHTGVEKAAYAGLSPTETSMTCQMRRCSRPCAKASSRTTRFAGIGSTACPTMSISTIPSMSPRA